MREIHNEYSEYAHRLLQCIAVAARPLRAEELAEFLAFDFNTGPIPHFREGWRLPDPVDAVLSTCPSLIAISNVHGPNIVQFSHFSVKKYLTSPLLAKSPDSIRRYHISPTHAHTLVALACLSILLHLDESVTRDSLEHFPLAEYAAKHWPDHARLEIVSQIVEDGMKQLFDPKKPHLAIWVWIHEPGVPSWMQIERAEKPLPPTGTPLHYATLCGLYSIVQFLIIEHSQDVNSRGFRDNSTPLHLASSAGHVELARILLKFGADVMAKDEQGRSPLHYASSKGHAEVAGMLLGGGADVTTKDEEGNSPLHLASTEGHVKVIQVLLDGAADARAQDQQGQSSLHSASSEGHVKLTRGANPNAENEDKETPLFLASSSGKLEAARLLLERNANPNHQDWQLGTPLHGASENGHDDIVQLLLKHSADVNAAHEYGWTPLHLASRTGNCTVARILLDGGAHVDPLNEFGWTPLHMASQKGHLEVVELLLNRKAQVNIQEADGETALHLAAYYGYLDVVKFLFGHGADLTRNNEDKTPLDLAMNEEHQDVAQLLRPPDYQQ